VAYIPRENSEKSERLLGREVEWDGEKLEEHPRFWPDVVVNTIDSNGTPFYEIEGLIGFGGLSNKLKLKAKKN
jgi:hypothetical protein